MKKLHIHLSGEKRFINGTWSILALLSWTGACTLYAGAFHFLFNYLQHTLQLNTPRWVAWFVCQILSTPVSILFVGIIMFTQWKFLWPTEYDLPLTEQLRKRAHTIQAFVMLAIFCLVNVLSVCSSLFFNIYYDWVILFYKVVAFIMPGAAFYWYNKFTLVNTELMTVKGKPSVFTWPVGSDLPEDTVVSTASVNESSEFGLSSSPLVREYIQITENNRIALRLLPEQLVAIQSQGNYVFVFWHEKGDRLEKTLVRCSISQIEYSLKSVPHFMRTHRSFILNMTKVIKVEGNARGLFVRAALLDETVLVARSQIGAFREYLTNESLSMKMIPSISTNKLSS